MKELLEGHYNDQYQSQRNNNNTRYGPRGGRGYRGGNNRYNPNQSEYYEESFGNNAQFEYQQHPSSSRKSHQSSSNNNNNGFDSGEGLTSDTVNGSSDNNAPKPQRVPKQQSNGIN